MPIFSLLHILPKLCCFFLLGIEVDYKGHMDGFPSGKMIITLLLLLWTEDHPAQCEIFKSKGAGGKKGC